MMKIDAVRNASPDTVLIKQASDLYIAPHRIVICFTMSPPLPVTPPSLEVADTDPGFFSKSFQNLRLSSAAIGLVSI